MALIIEKVLILTVFCIASALGQSVDRICAGPRFNTQCEQLQRSGSEVRCIYAQDSIECAQRIRNGTAEFGIFSAESVLHLATLGWSDMTVIKELRHQERIRQPYDYQSVVVVRDTFEEGLDNLKGKKFCHPGLHYSKADRWTERFLKHFERLVVPGDCSNGPSPAEIEAAAMSKHFSSACRPGAWSNNVEEDTKLKSKYKNLCTLCDGKNCDYDFASLPSLNKHKAALECLKKGGEVAYVSLQDAVEYFNNDAMNNFRFLCPNGSVQDIANNLSPCVWLSQPWKVIISSTSRTLALPPIIDRWMRAQGTSIWESAIREILTADNYAVQPVNNIQSPVDYIRPTRPIPFPSDLCNSKVNWCMKSYEEEAKCEVIRTAALVAGVYPIIECQMPARNTISCLNAIQENKADFMGIDSHFGYLARHPYELSAAMYQETEDEKYSSVVVLVKSDSKFERFENLKGAKACLPEFGGISSMAFINIGRNRGIFKKKECNYGKLLGDFFGESCAPGARDELHDPKGKNPESLCAICKAQISPASSKGVNITKVSANLERNHFCLADDTNRYYGTPGAFRCLEETGDVAILEWQNLYEHAQTMSLNPLDYKVICRNGTLASYPGFNVDRDCLLTTIVDGEIVVKRSSQKTTGIVNFLASLDKYLVNEPDFKMYNIFSGERNLLFEDSALGLVSSSETLSTEVKSYIDLFGNLENCHGGKGAAVVVSINVFLTIILAVFLSF